jgi:ABC-type branched-subunit amino acid transport system substrate-binding protein
MSENKKTNPEDQADSEVLHEVFVTRRDFLKKSGAVVAAVGLAGGLGGLLAACGDEDVTATTTAVDATTTAAGATTTVSAGPGPAQVLKIGNPVALSGFYSIQDVGTAQETKLMAEWLNEQGGITIKGERYEIEVVEADIKSSFDGVTAAVNSLVFDKGVKFLCGPGAFFNPPVSPIATQNKVLHVMAWCTNVPGEMDATTPYTFLGKCAWPGYMVAMPDFFKKQYPDVKKLGIICADDGAIPGYQEIAKLLLPPQGYEMADEWVGFANELQDFTPIAAKASTLDCDAYFMLTGVATHLGNIVKGLRELGVDKPYVTNLSANAKDVLEVIGDPNVSDVTTVTVTPGPNNPAVANELIDKVYAKYGTDQPLYFENSQCLYTLVRMIEKAQSIDPTEVKDFWETQTEVDTLMGTGIMGGTKVYGIKHAVTMPLRVQMIERGEVVDGGIFPAKELP